MSQAQKIIVYVLGWKREFEVPYTTTMRPRQRYKAAVRKAGAMVRQISSIRNPLWLNGLWWSISRPM